MISRDVEHESFSAASCKELLEKFKAKEPIPLGEELSFFGLDTDKDVYNISAPFEINGEIFVAGRVEERGKPEGAHVRFFKKIEGKFHLHEHTDPYQLEDGFVMQISNEVIFGGVQTYHKPVAGKKDEVGYRTTFHRGKNLDSLKEFASGPDSMKDIRLIELPTGKIGVFTRPQGEVGGLGKIGYFEVGTEMGT